MIILLHFRAFEPTPPSVSRMAPESFFSLRSSSLLLSSLLRFRGLPVSRLSAHASQVTLPNSAYTLYKLSVLCLFLAFASLLSQLWWAQVESNHRPHAYQACALTF